MQRLFTLILLATILPFFASAADYPAACKALFQLPNGTFMQGIDATLLGNEEVCKAYTFLLERNGTGSRGVVQGCYQYRPGIDKSISNPQADRILKLNPQFAVGLYKALTEIEKVYGGKNIIQSGFRCDGTANHPRGCAADIIWASCSKKYPGNTEAAWRCSSDVFDAPEQKWIDANGKNAPYNIHLRLRYAPEGHHVEPVNTQGCVTGSLVSSAYSASASPTSALTNAIRQALGAQPPAQPSATPVAPSQPLAMQQSPLESFTSTPLTPLTDTTTSASSSIADRLEDIARGEETPPTKSATSVPLVISASDTQTLTSMQAPESQQPASTAGGSPIQQTFTTQDFAWKGNVPQSGYEQILNSLQHILVRLLELLTPFNNHEAEFEY